MNIITALMAIALIVVTSFPADANRGSGRVEKEQKQTTIKK